jgi:hypothetical protein
MKRVTTSPRPAPVVGLWFEEPERPPRTSRISRTARIGVDYAGAISGAKKLRFVLGAHSAA